ncbi:outer membrane beta-barrel protein [Paraferrimonas haliotis]|uniref:outer membrane beta-barrel protein n=1 Tax=Paraferrimonas haliotis TaxID=2013866 RepID=UPI000BA928DB|nr:outer membrane beta-barrel protein [Paraferrimonas haliotis]
MKKQILALLAVSVLAAPAMAADNNQWFIGAEAGVSTDALKKGATKDDRRAEFGIKAGKYFGDQDQVRTYITYRGEQDGKKGDHIKSRSLLVSADYLVGLNQANTINWFVGATAGVTRISERVGPELYSSKKNTDDAVNNFAYGAQTGFKFDLGKNFEMELGYQYLRHTGKKDEIRFANDQRINLGASFKF